ncbi:MAG: phasin family protein [Pseudomonadales bacterium]|nr:phasin family protein [Pseudomonadales bacterium]
MSKDKTEMNEAKVTDKAGELAKKIWLAGLGAYGKAFDEASEQYGKVSKETSKMFEDLVKQGKKLDEENLEKLSDAKAKTSSTIEERIHKVKDSFGFLNLSMGGNQLEELNAKVDAIAEKLDALLDAAPKKTVTRTRKAATK